MSELLSISLAFPTAVFTALLVICALFWIVSMISGVGFDSLDLDADFDADIDADFDADFDADVDADFDADVDAGDAAGVSFLQLLAFVGIGKVPLSMWGTVFAFWGWVLSALIVSVVQDVATLNLLTSLGVLAVATAVTLPITGLVVSPLAMLFEVSSGYDSREQIIGGVCEVRSGRVDGDFGQARFETQGAELVISIRCAEPNELGRGDQALIIDYIEDDNTYFVEPMENLMGSTDMKKINEAVVLDGADGPDLVNEVIYEEQRETADVTD